jgi:hypothetical protein
MVRKRWLGTVAAQIGRNVLARISHAVSWRGGGERLWMRGARREREEGVLEQYVNVILSREDGEGSQNTTYVA